MKLIVGLGNNGEKYQDTRHNLGFKIVDKLVQDLGLINYKSSKNLNSDILVHKSLVVVKPLTMMNNSGIAVAKLALYYKIQMADLWVIHDDLDIKLGQYKIQFGRGPKDHNGLNSIYNKLGSNNFWHVRVGVDNRDNQGNTSNRIAGEEYVLKKFSQEEMDIIDTVIYKVTLELLNKIIS